MKKTHRIIRDMSLVTVFCAGFVGLIWFANSLQDVPAEEISSEFSQYRVNADEAAKEQDFDVSLQNLRDMVKKDPYDGRAQYRLASTLHSQITSLQRAIIEANSIDVFDIDSESPQEQPKPPSTTPDSSQDPNTENDITDDRIQTLIDQAIHEYQLAKKHIRYRLRSQFQLAVLWVAKGDHDAALDSLEDFVAGGGTIRNGLDQVEQFGTNDEGRPTGLHTHPRFAYLLELEAENRYGQHRYRNFEGSVQSRQRSANSERQLSSWSQSSENLWDDGFWAVLKRLNNDLIAYRIKLVNFIRVLLK